MSARTPGLAVGLALALTGAILVAVLVLPMPSLHSVIWDALENAAHAPIFGLAALVALKWLQRRPTLAKHEVRCYLLAFAIGFALGFAIEVVQFFGPRDADVSDLWTNALGAIGALTLHAAFGSGRGRGAHYALLSVAGLAVLAVLAPVATAIAATNGRDRAFPVLASFDSWLGTRLITTRGAAMQRDGWPEPLLVAHDGHALRVDLERPQWAGVVFEEPFPDWTGHDTLLIEVGNPGPQSMRLNVRIDDAWYGDRREDRYDQIFQIPARTRMTLRIPLEVIRTSLATRSFDLTHVSALMLFRLAGDPAERFYVGVIRLE